MMLMRSNEWVKSKKISLTGRTSGGLRGVVHDGAPRPKAKRGADPKPTCLKRP